MKASLIITSHFSRFHRAYQPPETTIWDMKLCGLVIQYSRPRLLYYYSLLTEFCDYKKLKVKIISLKSLYHIKRATNKNPVQIKLTNSHCKNKLSPNLTLKKKKIQTPFLLKNKNILAVKL